jgi:hypothetical protein
MCIRTVMPLAVFDHVLADGFRGKVGTGSGGKPGGVGNVAATAGAVVAVRPGSVGIGDGGAGTVTVTGDAVLHRGRAGAVRVLPTHDRSKR